MKLIGTFLSPFSRRVAVALTSRGMAFEHEDLNGYQDPVRARQVNPVGKVPVLVLDDGEHLFDSGVILDHLNSVCDPAWPLIPSGGRARREVLRNAAIATTIYEQSTARYSAERGPESPTRGELIDRYRTQTVNGLMALDADPGLADVPHVAQLDAGTISALVAFDYVGLTHPDLDPAVIAPALARLAGQMAQTAAFKDTRPTA